VVQRVMDVVVAAMETPAAGIRVRAGETGTASADFDLLRFLVHLFAIVNLFGRFLLRLDGSRSFGGLGFFNLHRNFRTMGRR
jgi:hypothetical protein